MRRSLAMIPSILCAVLASGFLCACGKSQPTPPPKVEDTAFGDLVASKERAKKDAEKAMAANKQKLEEAMKNSGEENKQ